MVDVMLDCTACGARFVWTHEQQTEAAKLIPLDDLMDTPGHVKLTIPQQPKQCGRCRRGENRGS